MSTGGGRWPLPACPGSGPPLVRAATGRAGADGRAGAARRPVWRTPWPGSPASRRRARRPRWLVAAAGVALRAAGRDARRGGSPPATPGASRTRCARGLLEPARPSPAAVAAAGGTGAGRGPRDHPAARPRPGAGHLPARARADRSSCRRCSSLVLACDRPALGRAGRGHPAAGAAVHGAGRQVHPGRHRRLPPGRWTGRHLVAELVRGLPVLTGSAAPPSRPRRWPPRRGDAHAHALALRLAFLSALVLELLATLSVALVAVTVGLRLIEAPRARGRAHRAAARARGLRAAARARRGAPRRPGRRAGRRGGAGGARGRRRRPRTPRRTTTTRAAPTSPSCGARSRYPGRAGAGAAAHDARRPARRAVALRGASGSGKSTLLAAAGRHPAARTPRVDGVVRRRPGAVAVVPQHPRTTVPPSPTSSPARGSARASTRSSARPGRRGARAGRARPRSPAARCTTLSPGELQRVALARALVRVRRGARLLLLDEPTAHLDDAAPRAGGRGPRRPARHRDHAAGDPRPGRSPRWPTAPSTSPRPARARRRGRPAAGGAPAAELPRRRARAEASRRRAGDRVAAAGAARAVAAGAAVVTGRGRADRRCPAG